MAADKPDGSLSGHTETIDGRSPARRAPESEPGAAGGAAAADDDSPATEAAQRYCPTCDRHFGLEVTRCPHDETELVRVGATVDPLLGRSIGAFTLRRRLGAGGMGAVYMAWQHSVGRE